MKSSLCFRIKSENESEQHLINAILDVSVHAAYADLFIVVADSQLRTEKVKSCFYATNIFSVEF